MGTIALILMGIAAFILLCDAGLDVLILGFLGIAVVVLFLIFVSQTYALIAAMCLLPCSIYWAVKKEPKKARQYFLWWVASVLVFVFISWLRWPK
jgi:hypothetical protein